MKTLVSIVVPIYNVEKYIHRCVESLLEQTYSNIEIILVDDDSPDSCSQICDNYSNIDNRIKVIHKANGGLSDARNAGMEVAIGDYITFIDSDDYVESTMIEDAVNALEVNDAEVAIWGFYADFVDESEKVIKSKTNLCISGFYSKDELRNIPITNDLIGIIGYAWNKMYKKELLMENGFSFIKGLSLVEDIVFNGPVLSKAEKIVFIQKPYVHYMQRPRETLGAKFYENYYELKKMAMHSVELLLNEWGQPKKVVDAVTIQLGFNALKSTIRLLSQSNNYKNDKKNTYLKLLLDQHDVQLVIKKTKTENIKDGLIKHLIRTKQHSLLLRVYSINNKGRGKCCDA